MNKIYTHTLNLDVQSPATLRQQIKGYFSNTYKLYETLFQSLACDDSWYIKSIELRHPLIFYYGHTATFFVNKLLLSGLITKRINPLFESMFAIGVDEMSWDDVDKTHYNWPSIEEVKNYREQVFELVLNIIDTAPLVMPIRWTHPWWVIIMGIEHELIHLETSSVLIRQHKLSFVKPIPGWSICPDINGQPPDNRMLTVDTGKVSLNKNFAYPFYGWDNEYGVHEAVVEEFQASQYLVSNKEFLQFVNADGYQTNTYWETEGLNWKNYTQVQHPTFWIKNINGWQLRTMTAVIDMPWSWPVEVNYHEAKAFCNWKKLISGLNIRLPTEDEYARIYENSFGNIINYADSEMFYDIKSEANIGLDKYTSSCPINYFKHGNFFDIIGNVWQWTETAIYPFTNFCPHEIYDDFSTPTFDGRHNIIKGGSWISRGNEALSTSRYAFRRHFFQHAGFRYIIAPVARRNSKLNLLEEKDKNPMDLTKEGEKLLSYYDQDSQVSQYIEFHYGSQYLKVPNFSQKLVEIASNYIQDLSSLHKALDIGCAVGRSSFELAKYFDRVDAVDFSTKLIQVGIVLAKDEALSYSVLDEGEIMLHKQTSLKQLNLQHIAHKVSFWQNDACNLHSKFTGYDFVLAANLIDRLYAPKKFLEEIHNRLNPEGILLISSPYTWINEYTNREEWLGGVYNEQGRACSSLDGLKKILGVHFKLLNEPIKVPFVIRETTNKFQHSFAEVTVWKKVLNS